MPKEELDELFSDEDVAPDEDASAEEDADEDKDEDAEAENDEDEKDEEDKVDFEKRYNDSQQFITELRTTNDAQEKSINLLTAKLEHLETVTKKTHEAVSDEDYDNFKAPEEDKDTEWDAKIKREEKALIAVFPDYYEIVGSNGAKDSPFLMAVNEDPTLRQRVLDAENHATEAYKIGTEFLLTKKKAEKKDPKKPKKKVPTLKDAPGSNEEPTNLPKNSLTDIFGAR